MCLLRVSSRFALVPVGTLFCPHQNRGRSSLSLHRPCSLAQPPQTHSGQLQAVLDIVLSHQGAALKSALMQRLMSALVLPAPEHYRALLRRLAALSGERLWA